MSEYIQYNIELTDELIGAIIDEFDLPVPSIPFLSSKEKDKMGEMLHDFIMDWIDDRFTPGEVFSVNDLDKWAERHNYRRDQ